MLQILVRVKNSAKRYTQFWESGNFSRGEGAAPRVATQAASGARCEQEIKLNFSSQATDLEALFGGSKFAIQRRLCEARSLLCANAPIGNSKNGQVAAVVLTRLQGGAADSPNGEFSSVNFEK